MAVSLRPAWFTEQFQDRQGYKEKKESSVLNKDFNLLNSFRQTLEETLLFLGSQSQIIAFIWCL